MDFELQPKNITRLVENLKGTDALLSDIQDDTFTDVVRDDGTELKDVKFDELQNPSP